MDHTLDELGGKLQPRHLLDEVIDRFWTREQQTTEKTKEAAVRAGRKFVDEVREHPLPSLLIGAGVIWLITQHRQGDTLESEPGLKEKAGEALGSAKERVQEGVESVKERASDIGEKAKEKMQSAWEGTKAKSSQMQDKVKGYYQDAAYKVRNTAEEYPLAIGLGCLAAGVIAGVLAPRNRAEDRVFGEASDRVRQKGKEQIQDLAEKGKHVAGRAFEAGKSEAEKQGLTPEGLREKAEEVRSGEPPAGVGL